MKKIISAILSITMIIPMLCACAAKEEKATVSYEDMTNIDWSQYINIGDYSKITLDMYPDVTDNEIERKIDSLLLSKSEKKDVTDRAAKNGDTVNIDFVGKIDGEAFSGGTAEGYNLELGSGSFISGFEDGLIGKKVGEQVSLNLTFPDPYKNNPDLAGKAVVFEVKINKITETVYPEFNDEFVKANTDYDSIEAYKTGTKKELEEEKHKDMVNYKSSFAYQAVVNNSTFTDQYPDAVYKQYYNEFIDYYTEKAKESNLELEDYLKTYLGYTEDQFKDEAKEHADNMTEQSIVIFRIAQLENLFLKDDAEYQKEALEYATEQGLSSIEELEEKLSTDDIKINIIWKRVVNLLIKNTVETGEYSDGTTEPEETDNN